MRSTPCVDGCCGPKLSSISWTSKSVWRLAADARRRAPSAAAATPAFVALGEVRGLVLLGLGDLVVAPSRDHLAIRVVRRGAAALGPFLGIDGRARVDPLEREVLAQRVALESVPGQDPAQVRVARRSGSRTCRRSRARDQLAARNTVAIEGTSSPSAAPHLTRMRAFFENE